MVKDLQSIQNSLNTQNYILGRKILYFKNIDSTMVYAKNLASKGYDENGTIILAKSQTSGRGRLGRSWLSPAGGLWMSILLYPYIQAEEILLITLAAGVCVCKTIEKFYNLIPGLKWPNDVVINNKKVCGILTEGCIEHNTIKYAILGIGINLNFSKELFPKELKKYATTLFSESNLLVKPEQFLYELLVELNINYKELINNNKYYILDQWKKYSVTIGREVIATYNNKTITGIAKGITSKGGLIIRLETGEDIEICSGEVTLRSKNSYV